MVPALDTGERVIGESQAINEFIEETFQSPALLPQAASDKAYVRFLCGLHDSQLEAPFRALYGHLDPAKRDPEHVAEYLPKVIAKLDALELLMASGPYMAGEQFTLADCAWAPTAVFLEKFLPLLEAPAFTDERPKLAQWWPHVQQRPSVAKALTEHREAVKAVFGL